MEITVVRSKKRKRTISARLINGVMVVQVPVSISETQLQPIITSLRLRIENKRLKEELNSKKELQDIFLKLNRDYFAGKLAVGQIGYVTDQVSKFGCCNCRSGEIRISHRVSAMPKWVKEYVVMHEMAHLVEANHGTDFWVLVNRFPYTERARGYLTAVGWESPDVPPPGTPPEQAPT